MTNIEANAPITFRKGNLRQIVGTILLYATVVAVSLITFFPVYWMLVSTFQPNKYSLHFPPP